MSYVCHCLPSVKFGEHNYSSGMGHSSNNISSFGLTDNIDYGFDSNNNDSSPDTFDYDNNNHPIGSVNDRDDETFHTNFLPTTYIGKQPSDANAPLETITNSRLPPAHPAPIYNIQSELSDLYDFGFANDIQCETNIFKTDHVSKPHCNISKC